MSLYRQAAKRDANEPSIVTALFAVGAYVFKMREPADLLVRFRREWFVLEVKDDDGTLTGKQEKDHAKVDDGAIPIVRTTAEALRAIGAIK